MGGTSQLQRRHLASRGVLLLAELHEIRGGRVMIHQLYAGALEGMEHGDIELKKGPVLPWVLGQ